MTRADLPDDVMASLLDVPETDETVLTRWSHYALTGSAGATLGRGQVGDLPMPEVNARTVLQHGDTEPADYLIVDRLGGGGMGIVVEAEQVYFGRRVALKMIKPTLAADPMATKAFFHEAVITSKLDHPGIVSILDLGITQDGRMFYAMKKASGTPWHRIIRDKTLDENLDILDRVADVVAYAHSHGILHRDLKPANIMLGDFGEVWLGDWGVALKRNAKGDFSHAHPGGTPQYMPPETAACRFSELGERSDVYSLGAVLFEILTNKPPHPGKAPPESLSNAAHNVIVESKSNDPLTAIAMQAMETLQHRRHASVVDFQKALHTCRAGRRSSTLVQEAEQILSQAKSRGEYDLFAKAISIFDAALAAEPQNTAAKAKRTKAVFAYFEAANSKGEFELAASVLQGLPGNRQAAELLQETETRKKRAARRKRNYRAAAVGGAVVILIVLGLALWYNSYIRSRQAMTREDVRREAIVENEQYLAVEMINSFRYLGNSASIPELYRMRPLVRMSGHEETMDACAPSVKRLAELLDSVWSLRNAPNTRDMITAHKFCRRFAQQRDELISLMAEIKSDAEKAPPEYSRNLFSLAMQIEHAMQFVDGYRKKYMDTDEE